MTTYLNMIEDGRGDLVDIEYYHGFCAPAEVRAQGAWPCPESIDYTVHCPVCEERVTDVGLTDWGISDVCSSGFAVAKETLDDWEFRHAIESGILIDRYGRTWGPMNWNEVCADCGQPDNCGDCNHEPLTDDQVLVLGGALAE